MIPHRGARTFAHCRAEAAIAVLAIDEIWRQAPRVPYRRDESHRLEVRELPRGGRRTSSPEGGSG